VPCVKTRASAPGKIILFGEHAVVSGTPAIGSAVGLRARVTVEDLPGRLEIALRDMGLTVTGFSVGPNGEVISLGSSEEAARAARYVAGVVRELDARDIRVIVESEIPVASGLGSSAAIVVAALAAVSSHMGLDLSVNQVAAQAHGIEKMVQQGLGSPMDTALSAFGGYQMVCGGASPLELPAIEMVVGCTSRPHDTRSEVARVQELRSAYPEVIGPIFQAVGEITRRAIPCIRDGSLMELGTLMNMNQGLLESIGAGTRELSELIYAARGAGGALGAKLTGAGGGGCMIALPEPGRQRDVLIALAQSRGSGFPVKTGAEGLIVETGIR